MDIKTYEECILNELNFDEEFIDYVLNKRYEKNPLIY